MFFYWRLGVLLCVRDKQGRYGASTRRSSGRGEDGAAVESNYTFPTFPARPRECIENVFAKEEFKCPPAAAVGRSEFEQGGKREVVVRRGSQRNSRGYTCCG